MPPYNIPSLAPPGQASFTQDPNPTNDPSYLGLAQGTSKPEPNQAYGSLFKGIGDTIDVGVTGFDTAKKIGLRKTIDTGVEQIQNEFGVAAATDKARAGGPPTSVKGDAGNSIFGDVPMSGDSVGAGPGGKGHGAPLGVTRLGSTIEELNTAYQAGKLSDSYYNGRLNALVKQTKAANPGYEDEVDNIIKDKTGIIPANALRKSLLADLDAAERAKNAAGTKEDTFIQNNLHVLGENAEAGYYGLKNGTISKTAIMGQIYRAQGLDNQLAHARLQATADAETAERLGIGVTGEYVANSMRTTAENANLPSFADINRQLQEARAAGKTPDPKQIATFVQSAKAQRELMAQHLYVRLHQPGENGEPSIAQSIGSEDKVNTMIQKGLAPLDSQISMLTDDKTGIANLDALTNKVKGDARTKSIIEQFPMVGDIGAVRREVGDRWLDAVVRDQTSNAFFDISHAVSGAILRNTHATPTGTAPPPLIGDVKRLDSTLATPKEKAEISFLAVKEHLQMLLQPDLPLDRAQVHAAKLFAPENANFLSAFQPDAQKKVFSMMVAPTMTRRMEELGKKDPEMWNQYQSWSINSFHGIFKQTADDLNANDSVRYVNLHFDPKSNQITYDLKPGDTAAQRNLQRTADKYGGKIPSVESSLAPMNNALRLIAPVFKTEGKEVLPEIYGLVAGMVKNPKYPGEGKADMKSFMKDLETTGGAEPPPPTPFSKGQTRVVPRSPALPFVQELSTPSLAEWTKNPVAARPIPLPKGQKTRGSVNLSDQEFISSVERDVPEGMSPQEALNTLTPKR